MTEPASTDRPLDAGDYVFVDFMPIRGREQGGTRPAIVLTPSLFHGISEMAIVCPVTGNQGDWPFKVAVPDGDPVEGMVLVDQVRSVHRPSRGFRRIGRASDGLLLEVRSVLASLTGIPMMHVIRGDRAQ